MCQDGNRSLPLHIAAQHGAVEVVKYLVEEQGCDVHYRNIVGNTPLHTAAFGNKLDILKYLVDEKGCDPMTTRGQRLHPCTLLCLCRRQC